MQNKQAYVDFIIAELNKGNVNYKDVSLVFFSNFKLSEPTFVKYWKLANTAHSEQRETINNAKINTTIELEKEAVKTALKSKFERLLILQKEIDNCIVELEDGFTDELRTNNEIIKRPLTIREKTNLRDTIKNLQAEVSKIEGDYAPTKAETDITFDNFSLKDVISFDKT
jgi:hypothetical protein